MLTPPVSSQQMVIRKVTKQISVTPPKGSRVWLLAFALLACTLLVSSVFFLHLYYKSKKLLDARLKAHRWSLPSTIYADSRVLYEGMPMKIENFTRHLQRLAYQRTEFGSDLKMGQWARSEDTVELFKHRLYRGHAAFPVRIRFSSGEVRKITNMSTNEDVPAYELEPLPISNLFGQEWKKRTLVPYNEFPPHLMQAVLSIEDRRFFQHGGVDLKAIARAILHDVFKRKQLQGGSTITQQLVKNFYLTPERSIKRKLSEAMIAWLMEKRLTKEQILELYLNEIYLGQRGAMSINGVGEASRLFFRKDAQHIDVPEAALLAGMIQAPTNYNPYRNPKWAKARRDVVLRAMRETGSINMDEFRKYVATPMQVQPLEARINLAPYFGGVVKAQLMDKYDAESIYTKNFHIFTTLDLDLQQYAEEALSAGLQSIDKVRLRKVKKPVEGALIAIEPQTGYIRAFVGGRSYSRSQYDRISKATRQPGSIFKPVVFAAAFEQAFREANQIFTPATLIEDAPWILRYSNKKWEPKNYDGRYYGIVTLRMALAQSMNVATAKLSQQIGVTHVAHLGKLLGFNSVRPFPSIALGAFEVSPWQVASAYTVFANGGVKTELRTVKKVVDSSGKTLQRNQIEVKRVLHPQTAYIITDMLKTVLSEGTGSAIRRWGFDRPAAGKTGTTDEYRDAWFVGYTPNLLCVVWTGYDDNTPIKMTGAQAALPIWFQFMKKAVQEMPVDDFSSPSGVVVRLIDPSTGSVATESCPGAKPEVFIQGTEPVDACRQHDSHWWSILGSSQVTN